ncbi:YccF domain-containing protein [Aquipuribacter sp. MA13-6]|uniref:YccF domain-containing protein n=1 Tax=unclassified Aquipuribacter TaxID=2635084 RepID=UPI003EEB0384
MTATRATGWDHVGVIALVLNVLWLVFAGLATALSYVLAGVIACVLIVTIPFGIACFRLAGYALWPFGRTVVGRPDAGVMSALGNVLWFVLIGWWLALSQVVYAVGLMLTIIGIPFGIAVLKLAILSFNPLGKEVVSSAEASGRYVPRIS